MDSVDNGIRDLKACTAVGSDIFISLPYTEYVSVCITVKEQLACQAATRFLPAVVVFAFLLSQ